jgi:hypothetical protein
MEADMDEIQLLLDVYCENKKEEALLKFCVADYIIAKTSQYSDESSRDTAWNQANEIRQLWTGETNKNRKLLEGETLTTAEMIEYQKQKEQFDISFSQYIQNLKN